MILVGNQRGGAKNLALHLTKEENDVVELYQLRGFVSDNLMGALNEAYAVSRATRCKQYLYSLSLNPPPNENVSTEAFVRAIDDIEDRLGLKGQPRCIVFHEKGDARRHCHAVWSRIDAAQMKAIPLPFTHRKLNDAARSLFIEHNWSMPRGFVRSEERDPRNFTLDEWQQAKRAGKDAKTIKEEFQDAWAISDSRAAFAQALKARGYWLARGDGAAFVAVDLRNEVYSVAKAIGIRTKHVRARLGSEDGLPSLAEAKAQIAQEMIPALEKLRSAEETKAHEQQNIIQQRRQTLIERQRSERQTLLDAQNQRQQEETADRQARFRKGLKGLWDRLRGEHRRIRERNEAELQQSLSRDRQERDALTFRQLDQRRRFKATLSQMREQFAGRARELDKDIKTLEAQKIEPIKATREERLREFTRERGERSAGIASKAPGAGRDRSHDR